MAEDVVGVDGSSDLAEVMQRLARVHRHKVSRNAVAQSVTHRLERSLGRCQCFEMTKIGDNELVALVVGTVAFHQSLTQVVEAGAC